MESVFSAIGSEFPFSSLSCESVALPSSDGRSSTSANSVIPYRSSDRTFLNKFCLTCFLGALASLEVGVDFLESSSVSSIASSMSCFSIATGLRPLIFLAESERGSSSTEEVSLERVDRLIVPKIKKLFR